MTVLELSFYCLLLCSLSCSSITGLAVTVLLGIAVLTIVLLYFTPSEDPDLYFAVEAAALFFSASLTIIIVFSHKVQ